MARKRSATPPSSRAEDIARLRIAGATWSDIGQRYKVSRQAVQQYLRYWLDRIPSHLRGVLKYK